METTPQIFLSCAREDREQAKEVYNRLKAEGFKPWMDTEDLLPGQYWKEEIHKALRDSEFAIVFFSTLSVSEGGYVKPDFEFVLNELRNFGPDDLVPVRLDECDMPLSFRLLASIDLYEQGGFEWIVHAIGNSTVRRDIGAGAVATDRFNFKVFVRFFFGILAVVAAVLAFVLSQPLLYGVALVLLLFVGIWWGTVISRRRRAAMKSIRPVTEIPPAPKENMLDIMEIRPKQPRESSKKEPTPAAQSKQPEPTPSKRPIDSQKKRPSKKSPLAQPVKPAKKVFICYRRADSIHITGRIYDRLKDYLGKENVFKDVDSIPLGVDFRKHIDAIITDCQVLLAVIGDKWLDPEPSKTMRRIDDPKDFVRIELESALQRNVSVIPVLVREATIPSESELPSSLQELAFRNGIVIRPDPDFHRDMDRLISGIDAL